MPPRERPVKKPRKRECRYGLGLPSGHAPIGYPAFLGGRLTPARAEGALIVKDSLPFIRYSECVTGPRAWVLRHNLNSYDASYVAPAEQLQCPLVTTDAKIERHVRTVEIKLY
ncbi:hypothetical protein GCM10028833_29650 [Glycomyces tarimensis]